MISSHREKVKAELRPNWQQCSFGALTTHLHQTQPWTGFVVTEEAYEKQPSEAWAQTTAQWLVFGTSVLVEAHGWVVAGKQDTAVILRDSEEEHYYHLLTWPRRSKTLKQCPQHKLNTKWMARALKNSEKCVLSILPNKQDLLCMG